MKSLLPPISPGEILKEEFLIPLGLSQNGLAKLLAIPPGRVNEIVRGRRSITADSALRLGRLFGTTPQFWLNIQNRYDLELVVDAKGAEIERILPLAS